MRVILGDYHHWEADKEDGDGLYAFLNVECKTTVWSAVHQSGVSKYTVYTVFNSSVEGLIIWACVHMD